MGRVGDKVGGKDYIHAKMSQIKSHGKRTIMIFCVPKTPRYRSECRSHLKYE